MSGRFFRSLSVTATICGAWERVGGLVPQLPKRGFLVRRNLNGKMVNASRGLLFDNRTKHNLTSG